jgi:hypothetical protein
MQFPQREARFGMIKSNTTATGASLLEEVLAGRGVCLRAAAALLPAGPSGRPASAGTLARWASAGARRPDGRRVRLQAVRVGGRLYTSEAALLRFLTQLNEG